MTYLDLMNSVLKRLREPQATSIDQNAYTSLIGEYINDAKRTVEDSWDWSALRTTITVPTVSDTHTYSLTGSGDNVKTINIINTTSKWFMIYKDRYWMDSTFFVNDPATSDPQYYTFYGIDSAGDTKVKLYPIPNGVYSIDFNVVKRQADLSTPTDVMLIPYMPVVHLATALASRERGETGGRGSMELFSFANSALSDAIALDSQKYPEELIYRAV